VLRSSKRSSRRVWHSSGSTSLSQSRLTPCAITKRREWVLLQSGSQYRGDRLHPYRGAHRRESRIHRRHIEIAVKLARVEDSVSVAVEGGLSVFLRSKAHSFRLWLSQEQVREARRASCQPAPAPSLNSARQRELYPRPKLPSPRPWRMSKDRPLLTQRSSRPSRFMSARESNRRQVR
jgi:hypothetical protein